MKLKEGHEQEVKILQNASMCIFNAEKYYIHRVKLTSKGDDSAQFMISIVEG